jgi:hypothetical protein
VSRALAVVLAATCLGLGAREAALEWETSAPLPVPRAAAGVGVAGGRIVIAGGVGAGRRLARNALVYDLRARRWSVVVGPTPPERLGVASLGGTVFAIGGGPEPGLTVSSANEALPIVP